MLTRFIIGPELFWLLIYLLALSLAKANLPPSKSVEGMIDQLYLLVPLMGLLAFGMYYLPFVEKNGLLLRLWLAGLVGGHLALERGLMGHSQQGPGLGTAYIVGMGLLFFAILAGTITILLVKR